MTPRVRSGGNWSAIAMLGAALVAAPSQLEAQSLVARAGLGLPVEPLDARSRAMGGAGIGLSGAYLLATDPAAAAGLVLPSVTGSYQPTRSTLTDGTRAGRARFPVVGASYPYRANVFSVQFSGFLDQDWEVSSERVLTVSGGSVGATDTFRSSGGIGQARIGVARRVAESLSIGLSLGTYTGSMERTFERVLDADDFGLDVEPFVIQAVGVRPERLRCSGRYGIRARFSSSRLRPPGRGTSSSDLPGKGSARTGRMQCPSSSGREGRSPWPGTWASRSGSATRTGAGLGPILRTRWPGGLRGATERASSGRPPRSWGDPYLFDWVPGISISRSRSVETPSPNGSCPVAWVSSSSRARGFRSRSSRSGSRTEPGTGGAVSEEFWRTTITVQVAGN